MPSPIILGDTSGIAEGLSGALNSVFQSLGQRTALAKAEEQRQKLRQESFEDQKRLRDLALAEKEMEGQKVAKFFQGRDLNKDYSPIELLNLKSEMLKGGIKPEFIESLTSVFLPGLKERAKIEGAAGFENTILGRSPAPQQGMQSINQQSTQTKSIDQIQEQNQSPDLLSKYTDDQLLALSKSPYKQQSDLANNLLKLKIDRDNERLKEDKDYRFEEYKRIQKFAEPYQDRRKFRKQINNLNRAEKLIESGKVSLDENFIRNFFTSIAEDKGAGALAEIFKTDEQKELFSLLREQLQSKEIGGSNPSTREVLIALSTLPNLFIGKQGNLNIIKQLKRVALMDDATSEYIQNTEPKGKTLVEFRNGLNEKLNKFNKLEKDMAVYFYKKNNNNIEKAKEEAASLGYIIED